MHQGVEQRKRTPFTGATAHPDSRILPSRASQHDAEDSKVLRFVVTRFRTNETYKQTHSGYRKDRDLAVAMSWPSQEN